LKVALPSLAIRSLLAVAVDDPQWGSERAHEILESAVVSSLSKSLRALKVPYRPTPLRGQQQADWIERSLFDRDVLGIGCAPHFSNRLDWWADIARSCLWWWPYREICVISDRPAEIHTLDGQHLHNDTGPAVRFRDGWSMWAIGGVVVDEQVVLHPDTQSVQQIRRERNAEVKRITIERLALDHYRIDGGAVTIDRRRNEIEATRETLLRTPEGETVLVCACPSTARIHRLAVPSQIQTCEQAQAWLSGGLAGQIINGA